MKEIVDKAMELLITWYQDKKIAAINESAILEALECVDGGSLGWDITNAVTIILTNLKEIENVPD